MICFPKTKISDNPWDFSCKHYLEVVWDWSQLWLQEKNCLQIEQKDGTNGEDNVQRDASSCPRSKNSSIIICLLAPQWVKWKKTQEDLTVERNMRGKFAWMHIGKPLCFFFFLLFSRKEQTNVSTSFFYELKSLVNGIHIVQHMIILHAYTCSLHACGSVKIFVDNKEEGEHCPSQGAFQGQTCWCELQQNRQSMERDTRSRTTWKNALTNEWDSEKREARWCITL